MSVVTGIVARHARGCASRAGDDCDCDPAYEAWVYSRREGKKIRKRFRGEGAFRFAGAWREEKRRALRDEYELISLLGEPIEGANGSVTDVCSRQSFNLQLGGRPVPLGRTLDEWARWFIEGARSGAIRQRSGMAYRPTTVSAYELHLLDPARPVAQYLGHHPVKRITQEWLQCLVDYMAREGATLKAIEGTLSPLRVIFRQARHAGEVRSDPTCGLLLPRVPVR